MSSSFLLLFSSQFLLFSALYISLTVSTANAFPNGNNVQLLQSEFFTNEFQQNDIIDSEFRLNCVAKLKLSDLNEDVLYLILDCMHFMDLLSIVEAIPNLSSLAISILRQRHYGVDICNAYPDDDFYGRKFSDDLIDRRFKINNFQLSLRVLKHFGSAIKWLRIQNGFILQQKADIIADSINKYASESLTSLQLGSVYTDTFHRFTVPFKNVQELSFTIETKTLANDFKPLNQTFPNVQSLNMYLRSNVNTSFIDCKLMQLKHLFLGVTDEAWPQREHFENLMRRNQQIRQIELRFLPQNYIEVVNAILPKIENLTIFDNFDIGNNQIHFENVKFFDLSSQSSRSIVNLSFSHLEILKAHYSSKHFQEWIDFFNHNKNISELHLYEHFDDRTVPLMELTAILRNLSALSLELNNWISVETVCQFIEHNNKLKHFQFVTPRFVESDAIRLKERFADEWHIQEIGNNWTGLSFERRANGIDALE